MAIEVFTSFTKKLAEYIGGSQTILITVATGLFSEHLVDGNAKRTAIAKGLIDGSTFLLDNVETKLKQDESLMDKVIDVLKRNEAISKIAKEMEEAYESVKSQRKRKPDGNGLASKPKQAKLDDDSDSGISDFDEEVVHIERTSIPRKAEIIVSSETTKGFGEDHKALAVIITNTYEGTTVPLIGIKKDRDELLQTFDRPPHFHYIRVDNALEEDMVDALKKAAEKARSCSYRCLVIAFSGHGGKHDGDSVIITEDLRKIPVKSFVDFVNATFSGIDIPKAFLIDACRGRAALPIRKSITEQDDSYLIASATKFGHIAAMRVPKEEGSYWMPVVARFIRERNMPIIDVIRAANKEVENDESLQYRQTPQLVDECFSSTLNIYADQGKTEIPKPNSGVEDTDNGEDHLQGVIISSSKLFTVHGDRPQSLIWEDHGFELHLPEGTCPPDKDCDVMVDCVVGGEFVFPKGVEPVSAIYLISVPLKPHKSPLLKIQHCVALNKASKNSCLSFYRASLKESRPPYHFIRVKGGIFDTHNQFGELRLPAFCGMVIGKFSTRSSEEKSTQSSSLGGMKHKLPTASEDSESPQSERNYSVDESIIFYGHAFYLRKQLNEWHFKFTVVKDLDAFTKYVRSNFTDHDADVKISLRFIADHIELALDREEASGYKGWTIEPHVHPTVLHFEHACSFGYEKRVSEPPTGLMTVAGDNTVTNFLKRLNCPVPLKGALIGDIQEPTIYIRRTMEENAPIELPDDQLENLKSIIINTHVRFFASIGKSVEGSLGSFAAELFENKIIGVAERESKKYSKMNNAFHAGFTWKMTVKQVESHCEKFLKCLSVLGGPAKGAAQVLRTAWHEAVQKEFKIPFLELKASKV